MLLPLAEPDNNSGVGAKYFLFGAEIPTKIHSFRKTSTSFFNRHTPLGHPRAIVRPRLHNTYLQETHENRYVREEGFRGKLILEKKLLFSIHSYIVLQGLTVFPGVCCS